MNKWVMTWTKVFLSKKKKEQKYSKLTVDIDVELESL